MRNGRVLAKSEFAFTFAREDLAHSRRNLHDLLMHATTKDLTLAYMVFI